VPSTPRPLDVSRNIQPEGWNWYKDPVLSPKQKESPKASPPPQQMPTTRPPPQPLKAPPKTAKERVKEMRERLEEQTAQAILDPTIANVQAVQKSQNQILDMSGKFETAWMASSLASGVGFDHESNPTPANRVLVDADKIAFTTGNLKAMSKKFGLFFCIKKGCQYCTAFAPVVKDFAQKYGFSVLTISKNGETIKGFDGVSDNGLLDKINPRGGYPALFLVSYDKTSILPIAWGFVNLQELEQNAWWILKQQKAGL
jgi:conjugal transfer pilus assembly protein TraF